MNDREIITHLKRENVAALESAMQAYSEYAMAVIDKTLGKWSTQEDKEELLSDVFVALWESRNKLRTDSNVKFWLAVVARNAALQHLRKLKLTEPLEENLLTEEEADVFSEAEQSERAAMVRLALDSLPEEDKNIFLRHYFWKQPVSAISRETGLNPSTVKSKLQRGRKKLKSFLIKNGYPDLSSSIPTTNKKRRAVPYEK